MSGRFIRQSGVIPFRFKNGAIQVLLITATGSGSSDAKKWVIPKGLVEPGLDPGESAQKEALEEAGVTGRLLEPSVGEYEYEKWGSPCRVELFLLEVLKVMDEWEESGLRDRRWCGWEDARSLVRYDTLRGFIGRLPESLSALGYRPA